MHRLIILALVLIGTAPAWGADKLNLQIWVDQAKSDEMPWNGCPHTFGAAPGGLLGLMGNPFQPSPPEIRLIIFRSDGTTTQHPNRACNDILQCEFSRIPMKNEVTGLLLFDADMSMRDLIDAMVMVPTKSKKGMAAA